MRRMFLTLIATAMILPMATAQDEFDDIYYNPSKSKKTEDSRASQTKKKSQSNYIADFGDMDVDEYNRRGFYYETPIDTIGETAENAEDFVYTQQIQKYYNPTIVVDNADVLADVLENSYGNVDITIENNTPVFTSIYTGGYGWAPSYYDWYYRPSWSWSYAYGWRWPSVSWNIGPFWGYYNPYMYGPYYYDPYYSYPMYYPGYGGYYPGYYPHHPAYGYYPPRPPHQGSHHASNHRPGSFRPGSPNAGWSERTPNVRNYNGQRPGSSNGTLARPGSSGNNGGYGTSGGRQYDGNRRGQNTVAVDRNKATQATRPSTGQMGVAGRNEMSTGNIRGGATNSSTSTMGNTNRTSRDRVSTTQQASSNKASSISESKGSSVSTSRERMSSSGSSRSSMSSGSSMSGSSRNSYSGSGSSSHGSSYRSSGSSSGSGFRSSGGGSMSRGGSSSGGSRSGGGGHRR